MSKKIAVLFLLIASATASAQIGGRYTYQFLNLVNSPRQAALGGKVITNYDWDPSQGLYNPASINPEMDNQLQINYVNYFADVNYGTASYAYLWDRRTQVLHAGVTYINYGQFDGFDEAGNPTNSFSGGEVALSAGYARNIPYTDFHVGANVKLISSKLEQYSSFGGAIDLAIMYVYEPWDLHISAVARNIGTQFTPFNEVYEPLPFELIFGISQTLQNIPIRWHFTLENMQVWNIAFENPNRSITDLEGGVVTENINFFDNAIRHMIFGLELFPESGFNIRLGYNVRRAEELRILEQRAFAGLSAGFGIKLNKIRLSYSYSQYSAAANASFFGLNIDLNR
ncbi:type IX secretion system protein PorQ [Gilvibacter sediminis]|uniref:type IX secretion system protein PorQ n=1 Tax=Gilvibacter sediminis TaxID=379071 RepID=UPI00235027A5|nr:type IX secretion system protein PorQ [Gilvibacter sediminis]MDC7997765.1 type IX secretion system protein PorQ [Gilvibacter sediminis]